MKEGAQPIAEQSGLTSEQAEFFDREGYLVVEDVISDDYLDPLLQEYADVLDGLMARCYAEGSISSTYDDLSFDGRLTKLYEETSREWVQHFDFSLPFNRLTSPDEPCHFGPSVFAMLVNPAILDLVEGIIGPEIVSNPVQHVRLKPPARAISDSQVSEHAGMLGRTPWHQDASVVTPDADDTQMITVWMPLKDATEENGCLRVAPRSHDAGLLQHCRDKAEGVHLPTELFDLDRAVTLPMRRGSLLIMTRTTPHSSLPNLSNEIRSSMDLRYSPLGQPTGRAEFPAFVARSRANPERELRDAEAWRASWLDTRRRMAESPELVGTFQRWVEGACA